MRILLVEDDAVLHGVMLRSLTEAGHRVDLARSVAEAQHFWRVQRFDAVLLDLNLPLDNTPGSMLGACRTLGVDSENASQRDQFLPDSPPHSGAMGQEDGKKWAAGAHSQPTIPKSDRLLGSGLTALRAARARGDRTPVLVLTARDRTEERIAGLDAGADDYLGKPFDLAEVEARLRALARRTQGADDHVCVGALALDRRARRFTAQGQPLELPAREFEVLWELMTPPGRVVSKRHLAEKLSGFDELLGDNALEAFISRLRKKLADSGAGIRTLRGLGYMLEAH